MEKNGYFFYCSDVFQKPLKIEFIPRKSIEEPKALNDFEIEIEGKNVSLEEVTLINDTPTLKYQKGTVFLTRFFWLAFAVVMCVFAFLALKTANYKMIFFAIGSLFLSILSDFVGTKLTFKKTNGKNLKLTLLVKNIKTNVFIFIDDNKEDLAVLFPSLFDGANEQLLNENENF